MLHITGLSATADGYEVSFASPQEIEPLPIAPTIDKIRALQCEVARVEQVELGLVHHFSSGMYTRECHIPAGTVVVGKLHRHDHPVMLIQGSATVVTDGHRETIHAPRVWTSPAGVKRAVLAHEDCIFVTVHATDLTDLDAIEAHVIEPEPDLPLGYQPDWHSNLLQEAYA